MGYWSSHLLSRALLAHAVSGVYLLPGIVQLVHSSVVASNSGQEVALLHRLMPFIGFALLHKPSPGRQFQLPDSAFLL